MGKEIERKYKVDAYPTNAKVLAKKEIHQTYLAIGQEEVRIRKSVDEIGESYVMTIKRGSGLVREEVEVDITKETYDQLLANGKAVPLQKTRTTIELGTYQAEIDVYQNGRHRQLAIVEVEFPSEEEANAFTAPDWFGQDVTQESYYKNQTLWREIQP